MSGFTLHLNSSDCCTDIEGVSQFIGEDESGSFGILPGRAALITELNYGLSRFCLENQPWQYLACPGAILHFNQNCLVINTRRYLISDSYSEITTELAGQLATEEENLCTVKTQLQQLEQELLQRMRSLERSPP